MGKTRLLASLGDPRRASQATWHHTTHTKEPANQGGGSWQPVGRRRVASSRPHKGPMCCAVLCCAVLCVVCWTTSSWVY